MLNYLFLSNFSQVLSTIWYIVLAILVLLVMITVHEFGHYISGKLLGFKIEEFAIGFGPKIFSKTKKDGEVFSVRLLPIGGFCSFLGEDKEEDKDNQGAFNNRKPWQRIIVLVSGAFMNFLLALLIIIIMLSAYGQPALMTGKTIQDDNYIGYSFEDRDVILEVEGKNTYSITDLMTCTEGKEQGDLVEFTVIRDGQTQQIQVKLREDTHYKNLEDFKKLFGAFGVVLEVGQDGEVISSGMYSTNVRFGFFTTVYRSFEYAFRLVGSIFKILGQLITGSLGISSLGGTVTTVSVTATAIKVGGFEYLLEIAALIGVNLAVFNLLPIPALDGSRVVFTAIEWARGKPVSRKVEGTIHMIGLIFLLVFAVFIDLQQCF